MDSKLVAIIALRGLSLTLRLQGLTRQADSIDRLILAYQAGRNVDAHLQAVADQLAAGEQASWDDILGRIETETEEFLSR